MRKINRTHSDNDKVICEVQPDIMKFYYYKNDSKETFWMFDRSFSGTVYELFRVYGKRLDSAKTFSMNIRQLYDIRPNLSFRVGKLLERLPGQIEYALLELEESRKAKPAPIAMPEFGRESRESRELDDDDFGIAI